MPRTPLSRLTAFSTAALTAAALALPTLAPLSAAQAEEPEAREGRPLDENFLRDQLFDSELRAALKDLLNAFEPVAKELDQMMRDIPQYEAPEILPNGDILIRRKKPNGEVET